MKTKIWTSLILGVVMIACCCVGSFFLFSGIELPHPSNVAGYSLVADGDRLYVTSDGTDSEFDVIKGKLGPVHNTTDGKTWVFTIDDSHGPIIKRDGNYVQNPLWSPRNSAAFFTSTQGDEIAFVRWTRRDGFKTVFKAKDSFLGRTTESLDGQYVVVQSTPDPSVRSNSNENHLTLVSTKTLEKETISMKGVDSSLIMIDKEQFLVVGNINVLVGTYQPYIWNFRTGKKAPMKGINHISEITVFQGRLWGIIDNSAVRLDPLLKGIDLTIPFSKDFIAKAFHEQ